MPKSSSDKLNSFWNFLDKYFVCISLVVLISVLALGYFFIFSGYLYNIKKLKQDVPQKNEEISQLKNYIEDLESLKKNYGVVSNDLVKSLDIMLPEKENIPDLLVWMEALAAGSGLRLLGIDVSREEFDTQKGRVGNKIEFLPGISFSFKEFKDENLLASNNLKPQSLNITLKVTSADYYALKDFLMALEKSLRVMDVQGFSYTPTDSEYVINIRSYFLERINP